MSNPPELATESRTSSSAGATFWMRHPWVAVVLTWLVYTGLSGAVSAACRAWLPDSAAAPQALLKSLLIAASIAAAFVGGVGLRDLGFRKAQNARWGRTVLAGMGLGALATVLIFSSGGAGLRPLLRGLSFAQIVLLVWVLSSLSEEVLCRGWFQTATLGADHSAAPIMKLLPSAVLFGSLHLSVAWAGIELFTVALLLPPLFALGLLTAWARSRTGSLYPAIAAHVGFNVGAVLGGVLFNLGYRLVTGHFPPGVGQP